MITGLGAQQVAFLRRAYDETGGKAWEPRDPTHPFFARAIREGYLRRVDGICGFERLKDAMVEWTGAAHAALNGGL